MKVVRHRATLALWIWGFFFFPVFLFSEDIRAVPLDLRLIVDGSTRPGDGMDGAIDWINRELIDGILQEGDSVTIWIAGDMAQMVHSETIGAEKDAIKGVFRELTAGSGAADFAGALREAYSRTGKGNALNVTFVVSGSAEALAPALQDSNLFRWSRVYESARWQVLAVDASLGDKVRRAAEAYMSGL